ncbi:MAG: ribonuclease P protein component [Desulfobulbus sp.]|nr:ribonuclease P protein component [Desulfobulbus sp.]
MDRNILPKTHLLRTNGEFQCVYRAGKRYHGYGFAVIVSANTLQWNRLGISVQRKAGNAVRRNRIKRLIREIFRCNRTRFPECSDIVVTVRPNFPFDSLEKLQNALLAILGDQHRVEGDVFR